MEHDELDILRNSPVPAPRAAARDSALEAALGAYDLKNTSAAPQGAEAGNRLTDRAWRLWRETMNRKMYATPAIAGLLALPIAGYTTYYLMKDSPFNFSPEEKISETGGDTKIVNERERRDGPVVTKPTNVDPAKKKDETDSGELSREITPTDMLADKEAKTEAPATVARENDSDVATPPPLPAPMGTVA